MYLERQKPRIANLIRKGNKVERFHCYQFQNYYKATITQHDIGPEENIRRSVRQTFESAPTQIYSMIFDKGHWVQEDSLSASS